MKLREWAMVIGTVAVVAVTMWLCQGCASVNYGPFSVKSFGTDVSFDSAAWIKTYTNGTTEALTVVGGKRNETESAHTFANLAFGAIGAIIGGAPTAGGGSAAGAGMGAAAGTLAADAYQRLMDWWKKTGQGASTNAPAATTTPTTTGATTTTTTLPPAPAADVVYVPGNMADKKQGSDSWRQWHGGDIRLSVNDGAHLAGVGVKDGWYVLDPEVIPEGAIVLEDNAAGEGVITVHDFTSTRTGARYHAAGFKMPSDSSPLRTENPCNFGVHATGTIRIMLGTIAK